MMRGHPVFACFYEAANLPVEWLGLSRIRAKLVGKLGGRILEAGAGNGLNFRHYRRTAAVIGLEPDPYMLGNAAPRARSAAARVCLVAGDGEALPFRTGSFDAVVSCLVLCTIPDARAALGEFRRVLRPGGALHFVEHVRAPARWTASLQDAIDPAWAWTFGGCHPNRDTRTVIERAGFTVQALVTGMRGLVIRGRALAG